MGQLYSVEVSPKVFERGFWLYAWKIVGPNGERLCYIGMTGDVTGVAQSPFGRASGHFGNNKTTNQIRRYLADRGIEPETCRSFKLLFYGPLFPYEHHGHGQPKTLEFEKSRKRVAALENQLMQEFKKAGYTMLNRAFRPVAGTDDLLWGAIQEVFGDQL